MVSNGWNRVKNVFASRSSKTTGAHVVQRLDAITLHGLRPACKLEWITQAERQCQASVQRRSKKSPVPAQDDLDCQDLITYHTQIIAHYSQQKGVFERATGCPRVPFPGKQGYQSFNLSSTGMTAGQQALAASQSAPNSLLNMVSSSSSSGAPPLPQRPPSNPSGWNSDPQGSDNLENGGDQNEMDDGNMGSMLDPSSSSDDPSFTSPNGDINP